MADILEFPSRSARKSPPAGAEVNVAPIGDPNEGLHIAEFELGFIVIGRNSIQEIAEPHVYVADLHTMPSERRKGVARDMIERTAAMARLGPFKALYAGVPIDRAGLENEHEAPEVLSQFLRSTGFKLHSGDQHSLLYRREL